MMLVKGRVLKAPAIRVGDDEICHVDDGQWAYGGRKLFTCKKITSWAVINFCSSIKTSDFCANFIEHARAKGMIVEEPALKFDEDEGTKNLPASDRVEHIFKALKAK